MNEDRQPAMDFARLRLMCPKTIDSTNAHKKQHISFLSVFRPIIIWKICFYVLYLQYLNLRYVQGVLFYCIF
jgi:hypothetical protein